MNEWNEDNGKEDNGKERTEKEPIFKEHEKLKMALVIAITLGLYYFVMSTILRVPI